MDTTDVQSGRVGLTLETVLASPILAAPGGVYLQQVPIRFDYPVIFQAGCLDVSSTALRWAMAREAKSGPTRVVAIVDSGMLHSTPGFRAALSKYFAAHSDALSLVGDPIVVLGGEQAKADGSLVHDLLRQLLERRLDRHSVAVIFGGGAVLDAAGFAAATFHRGMRVVRVPTTVLAQNDAGVGVKNGVNAFGVKNLVGTFQPPYAVICDSEFLRTLEDRDVRAGLAEAVKVALIRDPEFFAWIGRNIEALVSRDNAALAESVRRAAVLHLEHIAQGGDPFESGSARPLDFGHWSAHKLEALTHHELRHGEAVAIGIALDVRYCENIGLLPSSAANEILRVLARLGFRLEHEVLADADAVLLGLEEFREHIGGELTLTLIRGPGQAVEVHEVNSVAMRKAIARVHTQGAL